MTQERTPYCPPFVPMRTVLADIESSHWGLKSIIITEQEAEHERAMASFRFGGRYYRDVAAGEYIGLYHRKSDSNKWHYDPIMSDTPMERRTNAEFLQNANGDILIGGLGIGMIIIAAAMTPTVKSITVIEKDPEIIQLVEPQLQIWLTKNAPIVTLTVYEDDVETWTTTNKYDTIYMDIWPTICSDNWDQMKRLSRKYRRHLNKKNAKAWLGMWELEQVRYDARGI